MDPMEGHDGSTSDNTRSDPSTISPSNWQFHWMAPLYDWFTWHRNWDLLLDVLDLSPGMNGLDLGGGTAQLAEVLSQRGITPELLLLIDRNRSMLRQAKRKQTAVQLVRGDSTCLPLREGCLDRIFLGDAFHHMPRPDRVLGEAARTLRSGGKLVFEEFDPDHLLGNVVYFLERLGGMGSRFYPPRQLQEFVEEGPFRWEREEVKGFVYYAAFERL